MGNNTFQPIGDGYIALLAVLDLSDLTEAHNSFYARNKTPGRTAREKFPKPSQLP